MNTLNSFKFLTYTLEELLGPLNDIEERYAPKEIFVSGDLPIPLPKPRAAIIGSRKASPEGLKTASNIARILVKNGVIIVSGLARGIDTAAHKTTIEEGGDTVAVLGTPLDKVYPKENSQLQDFIMRNHLAISQFPSNYPIQPKNFVIRNRTMALISDVSIIVEAKDSSGSLHQGWEALRLGRSLFICESIVNDDSLTWPKKMLDYGAMILTDPEQVLDFLPSNEVTLKIPL
jgi:DNA processing protein